MNPSSLSSKKSRLLPFFSLPTLYATLAASALLACSAHQAKALPVFTETFSTDASNWKTNGAGTTSPTWNSSGGPGGVGDGYVSLAAPTTVTGQGTIVLRGQQNFTGNANNPVNSSGGAFVGDWLSTGVTNFSIAIRQDSGVNLSFYFRLATTANSPAGSTVPFTVPSGIWTNISIPITDSTSVFQSYEGGTFNSVFSNIGNVQIAISSGGTTLNIPAGTTLSFDNVAVVPEPGSLALLGVAGVGGLLMYRRRR